MRTKSHTINYLRWVARTINYCPRFTGTALDYILSQLKMYNRCTLDKVTFFDLSFTDEQIDILRHRWYNVPLDIPDISHEQLLAHKEQIRQSKVIA